MQNEVKTEEVFSLQLDSSQLYESMRDVNKTVGASGDCRLVIDESLENKVLLVLGHGSGDDRGYTIWEMPVDKVSGRGACLITPNMWRQIARQIEDDSITLSYRVISGRMLNGKPLPDSEELHFESKSASGFQYAMRCNPEHYEDAVTLLSDRESSPTINSKDFKNALLHLYRVTGEEYRNFHRIKINDDHIFATDGARIAFVDNRFGLKPGEQLEIPEQVAKSIIDAIPNNGEIELGLKDGFLSVKHDGVTIVAKLVKSEFDNFDHMLGEEGEFNVDSYIPIITIKTKELRNLINDAWKGRTELCKNRGRGLGGALRLFVKDGKVVATSVTGAFSTSIECPHEEGIEWVGLFDGQFLKQMLMNVDSEVMLHICSKANNLFASSKLMLGDFNGFRHTLMGMEDSSVELYKNVTSKL